MHKKKIFLKNIINKLFKKKFYNHYDFIYKKKFYFIKFYQKNIKNYF